MYIAIDFDHQFHCRAVEINDEAINAVLPAELHPSSCWRRKYCQR